MSDILTELQALIADRITDHPDLASLFVLQETNGDLDEQIRDAVQSRGIVALVYADGLAASGDEGHKEIRFSIEVHEDTEVNMDGDNTEALGIPASQVVETICFAESPSVLKQWQPSAVFSRIKEIGFHKLEVSPHFVLEITAATSIFIP